MMQKKETFIIDSAEERVMLSHKVMYMVEEIFYKQGFEGDFKVDVSINVKQI